MLIKVPETVPVIKSRTINLRDFTLSKIIFLCLHLLCLIVCELVTGRYFTCQIFAYQNKWNFPIVDLNNKTRGGDNLEGNNLKLPDSYKLINLIYVQLSKTYKDGYLLNVDL